MQESFIENAFGVGMAVLLMTVGIYLTVRLRAVQLRHCFPSVLSLKGAKRNGVSSFSAACTNLGATVGMGNVLGVAAAVSAGGAGSLLWMLIAAFFGMAIRYTENWFGAKTRTESNGTSYGGPQIYIERYFPRFGRMLGRLFAEICVVGSLFGMGAALQACCIRTVWADRFDSGTTGPVILAVLLLLMLTPVLIGGSVRIAKCAEWVVPYMALGYVACCLWILIRYRMAIPSVLLNIVRSGLHLRSAAGASFGLFLRQTVLTGIRRGLFSNEAGLGLGAITAASASDADPQSAGEIGILVTFLDTFVICLITGLCLLVTQQSDPADAWKIGIPWAGDAATVLLSVFLTVFALTSILGSCFYAESCLRSLYRGARTIKAYRIACLFSAVIGVFLPAEPLWRCADLLNASLAILNLPSLCFAVRKCRSIRSQ